MKDWRKKYRAIFFLMGFILWMILFYGIYKFNTRYILNDLYPKTLSVDVKFKTSEDDIFQLFYRDSTVNLNEKFSESIIVKASEDYQWIKFLIPDTLNLMQIRFDFGNRFKVTPVAIDQFRFNYKQHSQSIKRDSIFNYFRDNSYVTIEPNGEFGRKVINDRSDPFLLSNDLRPTIHELKQRRGDKTVLLNLALSCVLSLSIFVGIYWVLLAKQPILTEKQLFIILFLALIYLPILDSLFSLDNTQIQEKRELNIRPELNEIRIVDYPKAFESYFNDNFGFRKAMITYGGLLKAKIFHTSPNRDKIIIGKNGWIFYWNEDIQHSYKNERPWEKDQDLRIKSMLSGAHNWANTHDKYFMATIYPNKHSVYEENLPKRIRSLKRDTINRTTQTFNLLKSLQIPHVKLLKTFQELKTRTQLFHKNDTHWNSNGAFYGYTAIVNQISTNVDGIPAPFKFDEFIYKENEFITNGDLLDFMGVDNRSGYFVDTEYKYNLINETNIITHKDYLGPGNFLIENKSLKNGGTLLIIGDSFTHELLKFMPLNFEKTYFIRSILIDLKWLDKIDPDVILYGVVERNLENL